MTSLKIAMLTTFYPPFSFGGDAIGVQRLSKGLANKGYQVTVIHDLDAFDALSNIKEVEAASQDDVSVIGLKSRLGALSSLLTHQLGRPVVHRNRLRQILSPGAFDIIWFSNPSLIGGPELFSYGDGLKVYEAHEHWLVCPTHILWRHNKELCDDRQCIRCVLSYRRPPQLWRYNGFFERQLDHIDAFIAKSEFSRQKHAEFGFNRKMQVVPYFLPEAPSVDDSDDASVHSRPYYLFVGRLERIKGLDDVIPVFSDYPDADLLIVGEGSHEEVLRRQAAGLRNVKFIGRLAPEKISRYYRSAIGLIVPSVCYETFGITIIEAFRESTPVIARRIGPFEEIVGGSKGGFVYSNRDELIEAMRELQCNTNCRKSMATAARTAFEKRWGEKIVLQQYEHVIHDAALASNRKHIASAIEQEL